MTALMTAAKAGHFRVVATLLHYGANVNITNRVSEILIVRIVCDSIENSQGYNKAVGLSFTK